MVKKVPKTIHEYSCDHCNYTNHNKKMTEHHEARCPDRPNIPARTKHEFEGAYIKVIVDLKCVKCGKVFEGEGEVDCMGFSVSHTKKYKCTHCGKTTVLEEEETEDIDWG